MNRAAFVLAPVLALLLPAVAPAKVPVAVPDGAPVHCVPIVAIERTAVRDDRTIDFFMRTRPRVYRVTLPRTCPELGFEGAFSYETSLSQLCDVDIITVFRQLGPDRRGASCGLGPFQPVALAR